MDASPTELAPAAPTLQSGVCFAAYPDPALAATLAQWIGCQRAIYNAKVEEDRLFAAQRRLVLRDDPSALLSTPVDRLYAQFKDRDLTPWLFEVPSQVLREGTYRWMTAKTRQLKGLGRAPTKRSRHTFNSVLLTQDLFRIRQVKNARTGHVQHVVELGTRAKPVGLLPFKAHRPYGAPKMLSIRRAAGHWSVSFSFAHAAPEGFVPRTPQELCYELDLLDDATLHDVSLGLDRNVRDNAVATSDGRMFALLPIEQERLARKELGARRYQRRLARKQKGSANRRKAIARLAAKHRYRGCVATNFSHQTSHAIVAKSAVAPRLIALENLNIRGMVRRPKAVKNEQGRWLSNRRAQKAGLARAILASCWGRIASQLDYKGERAQVLVLKVPAAHSSQECSLCGHIHPDNRHEQRFVCQRCGHAEHADLNAARNIARRGVSLVRQGLPAPKTTKRVALKRKHSAGAGCPGVPVEGRVRHEPASAGLAQRPLKQERRAARLDAPTTPPPGG